MTRTLVLVAVVALHLIVAPIIYYRLGRMDERQLSQPIACQPNVDTVRVVPTRYPRPTDPVRSAP